MEPNHTRRPSATPRSDNKSILTTLHATSALGVASLTLAGIGVFAYTEATATAQAAGGNAGLVAAAAQNTLEDAAPQAASQLTTNRAPMSRVSSSPARVRPTATPGASVTATSLPLPTATPTAAPDTDATATKKYTLDIVQWVETRQGDPVAVVRDGRGVLWYVWGPDVDRIEQGLSPEYSPQAVNASGQSRGS